MCESDIMTLSINTLKIYPQDILHNHSAMIIITFRKFNSDIILFLIYTPYSDFSNCINTVFYIFLLIQDPFKNHTQHLLIMPL